MSWRVIDTDIADPFYVTAADDAIAQGKKRKETPNTLHFYRRDSPTISVGRFGQIAEDINIIECKKDNIQIVRRTTGGGAIYTDKGCLIYSLIFDKHSAGLHNPQVIFEKVCNSIVSALERHGYFATYKPPNDILLHGKKISGSAQVIKENVHLIHGTVLVDTDLDVMFRVLKKAKNRKVSSLQRETDTIPSMQDLKVELLRSFGDLFSTPMVKGAFTAYEKHLITTLLRDRYQTDQWNLLR